MQIFVEAISPFEDDAVLLLSELSATLARLTGDTGEASFAHKDVMGERAVFVIARDGSGQVLGCGALRPLSQGVAELKRMFARPSSRRVGKALLHYLEQYAVASGYDEIWLETRRVNHHAVGFYLHHGYIEIPSFGKYVGRADAICLGKRIGPK